MERPFDAVKGRTLDCDSTAHPDGLAEQTTFTKETPRSQKGQNCFLPGRRYHSDLHLSVLNKVNGFGCVTLCKDLFVPGELHYGLSFRDSLEQCREIGIGNNIGGPRPPWFGGRCFPAPSSVLHILSIY